ncbi:zinc ribbon domain-containing protein [bacterium]|nr:zinc ribbon domain-containing protein [bacterium]
MKKCQNCNHYADDDSKYCPKCGSLLPCKPENSGSIRNDEEKSGTKILLIFVLLALAGFGMWFLSTNTTFFYSLSHTHIQHEVFFGILGVLLVFYIIALVMSHKNNSICISVNGWDKAMLLIAPTALFIANFWGWDEPVNTAQGVFLTISGVCLVGTIIMTLFYSNGHFGWIIISILAKIFIFWLTIFIIALLLALAVIFIMFSFIGDHSSDDEVIILKYDRFLDAYVGYRRR